jgi:hypothetical protein
MNIYGEYLTENLKGRDDVQDKKVNRRIILLDQQLHKHVKHGH